MEFEEFDKVNESQPAGGGEGRGKGKGTKALKNKAVDGIGGTFLFYGDCSFNEVI